MQSHDNITLLYLAVPAHGLDALGFNQYVSKVGWVTSFDAINHVFHF